MCLISRTQFNPVIHLIIREMFTFPFLQHPKSTLFTCLRNDACCWFRAIRERSGLFRCRFVTYFLRKPINRESRPNENKAIVAQTSYKWLFSCDFSTKPIWWARTLRPYVSFTFMGCVVVERVKCRGVGSCRVKTQQWENSTAYLLHKYIRNASRGIWTGLSLGFERNKSTPLPA